MGAKTDTRERMVTSAALMLRERGVAGTTVSGVLEASGAPRGSVGFHFPGGRAELLSDALRWVGGLVSSRLRAGVDAGVPAAGLFGGIGAYYKQQLLESDFTAGCPVGAAAQEDYGDADLGPIIAEIVDEWTGLLAESLTRTGRDEADARDAALAAISALEGAIMMARVTRSTRPVDLVLDLVLPTLAA